MEDALKEQRFGNAHEIEQLHIAEDWRTEQHKPVTQVSMQTGEVELF